MAVRWSRPTQSVGGKSRSHGAVQVLALINGRDQRQYSLGHHVNADDGRSCSSRLSLEYAFTGELDYRIM
jgi:hypothetical protein